MFGKSICILLAVLIAFTAAETNSKQQRQTFPEQFSQFTNQFQEAFVNPSGGNPNIPQFPIGQLPNGFPAPGMPFSRRQIPDIASTIKDRIPFPMGSRHGYHY